MTEHSEHGGGVDSIPEMPPADETARVERAAAQADEPTSWLARTLSSPAMRNAGLAVVFVLICIIGLWSAGDRFGTQANVLVILRSAAVIGVVSVGMTFVIIGGGIDLSVGAIVGLASVWATTVATQDYGPYAMIFTAVVVATACGLINGVLIAYGRIVPFIATLAMLASARGVAEEISKKQTQSVSELRFTRIFAGDRLGIPTLVIMWAAVALIGWLVLNRTTFGRRTFAVGGNPEAARLAGIDVRRQVLLLYALLGVCCGVAAIMVTARTTAGSSTHGTFYELDAIAAVVIGGTLLAGGRGTIAGTVLGVLIFATVNNIFTLNNYTTSRQAVAKGLIIVAAVLFQQRLARSTRTT